MRRAALPALNRLLPNVGTLKSLNHRVNLFWCQQRGEVAGSQDLANLEVRTEFSKLRQICHRDYSTNIGDWKLASRSRGGGIEVDEVTAEGRCQDVLRRERADIRGEFGGPHRGERAFQQTAKINCSIDGAEDVTKTQDCYPCLWANARPSKIY
jgi:hypothetical protein